jgi:hypothetical protein
VYYVPRKALIEVLLYLPEKVFSHGSCKLEIFFRVREVHDHHRIRKLAYCYAH